MAGQRGAMREARVDAAAGAQQPDAVGTQQPQAARARGLDRRRGEAPAAGCGRIEARADDNGSPAALRPEFSHEPRHRRGRRAEHGKLRRSRQRRHGAKRRPPGDRVAADVHQPQRAANPDCSRFAATLPPTLPSRSEAPITAMEAGLSRGSRLRLTRPTMQERACPGQAPCDGCGSGRCRRSVNHMGRMPRRIVTGLTQGRIAMAHAFRNHRYFSWGWLLWFGIVLLFFSSSGNRGYTYSAHQKYHRPRRSEAFWPPRCTLRRGRDHAGATCGDEIRASQGLKCRLQAALPSLTTAAGSTRQPKAEPATSIGPACSRDAAPGALPSALPQDASALQWHLHPVALRDRTRGVVVYRTCRGHRHPIDAGSRLRAGD